MPVIAATGSDLLGFPGILPVSSPTVRGATFTYISDGDAFGIFYFAGTNFTAITPWVNPHTAGYLVGIRSTDNAGTITDLFDRATNLTNTNNTANSWFAVDIGLAKSIVVSKYTIRNRNFADRAIRNWKLQGSNNAASNSVADIAAATWTDLDSRVSDTTMPNTANVYVTYSLSSTPAAYRWIRFLQNGLNAGGDNFLTMAEWELYGALTYF